MLRSAPRRRARLLNAGRDQGTRSTPRPLLTAGSRTGSCRAKKLTPARFLAKSSQRRCERRPRRSQPEGASKRSHALPGLPALQPQAIPSRHLPARRGSRLRLSPGPGPAGAAPVSARTVQRRRQASAGARAQPGCAWPGSSLRPQATGSQLQATGQLGGGTRSPTRWPQLQRLPQVEAAGRKHLHADCGPRSGSLPSGGGSQPRRGAVRGQRSAFRARSCFSLPPTPNISSPSEWGSRWRSR